MSDSLASQITSTLGAMYIGSLTMMILYGITTLQTYFYFNHYPNDSPTLKLLVLSIWILDSLQAVFVSHSMYHYLVLSFGIPQNLFEGTWSLFSSTLVNLVIAVIVQSYFAQRIHILCPQRYKVIVTSVLVFWIIVHFVFGVETVYKLFEIKVLSELPTIKYTTVLPFGIGAVVSDILIALALCILLSGNRSEFVDTNRLLNSLIVFAINRCLLTSLVAISQVIVFSINPNSFYTLAIDFIIGKLYANSILASLNSRRAFANGHRSTPHLATGTSIHFRLSDNNSHGTTTDSSTAERGAVDEFQMDETKVVKLSTISYKEGGREGAEGADVINIDMERIDV